MDYSSRKWQLTINNPEISRELMILKIEELKSLIYFCMADEIGKENGTPHTHIFINTKNPVRFSRIKKLFPTAHIEKALGTIVQNRDYITKSGKWEDDEKADTKIEGSFYENREPPEEPGQGARTDITTLYELITDGLSNAEIMAEQPELSTHIGKMDKIRQDILEEKFKNTWRDLTVTYIFGATGTGKTRGVMEKHGYSNVYRVTDYTHPFDRYAQQEVLCFDEFRSSLILGDMLMYLDGYPLALPARYAARQACYEKVYIISNIDLKKQYPTLQGLESESWKAFLRRIHKVIEYKADGTIIDHGSALDYIYADINKFTVVTDCADPFGKGGEKNEIIQTDFRKRKKSKF